MNTKIDHNVVAVAGADIDPLLSTNLTRGDNVLVEMNGRRVWSELENPLVAEIPWTIEEINAPIEIENANEDHYILLSHPKVDRMLRLHYMNMLETENDRQPAVFKEKDKEFSSRPDGSANPIYVILQLISHYAVRGETTKNMKPWKEEECAFCLADDDLRYIIFEQWTKVFKTFKRDRGWDHKSFNRFCMRAMLGKQDLRAFANEDWDAIEAIPSDKLLRIWETLHWTAPILSRQPIQESSGDGMKITGEPLKA